jgi:glycosyltransferase involved in cell wall biosynthesis
MNEKNHAAFPPEAVAPREGAASTRQQRASGRQEPADSRVIALRDIQVCMLVYNEEQFVRHSLEALAKFIDRFLIVDMGSEDKTLDIVMNLLGERAQIIQYDREMLFTRGYAHARNYGTEFATSPWILAIDADEVLTCGISDDGVMVDRPLTDLSIVTVERRNIKKRIDENLGSLNLLGSELRSSERHRRLYRNENSIHWAGYIHESLYHRERPSTPRCEGASGIILYHLADFRDPVRDRWKRSQYSWMLLRAYRDRRLRDAISSHWFDNYVVPNLATVEAESRAFLKAQRNERLALLTHDEIDSDLTDNKEANDPGEPVTGNVAEEGKG